MLIQAGQIGPRPVVRGAMGGTGVRDLPQSGAGKQHMPGSRTAVADAGRDPDLVKVTPACYVIVAESEDAAQAKRAVIEAWPSRSMRWC